MMNETLHSETDAKPYPRHCCECGQTAVVPATISHLAKIKHDGKLHEFLIDGLPIDQCNHCGEQFFTNVTSDAKSTALRSHLGLLQPSDIRDLLSKHQLTQRKLAAHLRVAEETISRWLNGLSIQSKALDTFLRLYFTIDEVRIVLAASDFPAQISAPHPRSNSNSVGVSEIEYCRLKQLFGRNFSETTLKRSTRFQLTGTQN